jgi:hypothetical protein
VEGTVQVDPHRFLPKLRVLFPDHPLVSRTDTVVADQDFNRAQPSFGFRNGQRASTGGSQVRGHVFEPKLGQLVFAAGRGHDLRSAGGEQLGSGLPNSAARARDQRDSAFDTCHVILRLLLNFLTQ